MNPDIRITEEDIGNNWAPAYVTRMAFNAAARDGRVCEVRLEFDGWSLNRKSLEESLDEPGLRGREGASLVAALLDRHPGSLYSLSADAGFVSAGAAAGETVRLSFEGGKVSRAVFFNAQTYGSRNADAGERAAIDKKFALQTSFTFA